MVSAHVGPTCALFITAVGEQWRNSAITDIGQRRLKAKTELLGPYRVHNMLDSNNTDTPSHRRKQSNIGVSVWRFGTIIIQTERANEIKARMSSAERRSLNILPFIQTEVAKSSGVSCMVFPGRY